jgi:hypothetical protein
MTQGERALVELQKMFPGDVHWRFADARDFLSGELTVHAVRDGVVGEVAVSFHHLEACESAAVRLLEVMRQAYGRLLVREQSMRKRGKWVGWHARTPRVARRCWPLLRKGE